MRVNKIRVKGMNRTREAVVDLDALGPGLIAIAGKNGAGKTTLLETVHAAHYLTYASRDGNIADRARGRDSEIEVEATEKGIRFRSLVAIDSVARKVEPYLFIGGVPVEECKDGKVGAYKEKVRATFGSEAMSLSCALCAQNRKGTFGQLAKSERKDLVSEVLDTQGLQEIALAAKEKKDQAEKSLVSLRADAAAIEKELSSITLGPSDLEALRAQLSASGILLNAAELRLETAREAHRKASADLAVAEEKARARAQKEADFEAAGEEARRTVVALLEIPPSIEALRARVGAGDRSHSILQEIEGIPKKLAGVFTVEDAKIFEAEMEAARLREYEEAEKSAERLRSLIEGDEKVMVGLVLDLKAAENASAEGSGLLKRMQILQAQIDAIEPQTRLLSEVPCKGAEEYSGCKLLGAAVAAKPVLEARKKDLKDLGAAPDMASLNARVEGLSTQIANLQEVISKNRSAREAALFTASRKDLALNASKRIEEAQAAKAQAVVDTEALNVKLKADFEQEYARVARELKDGEAEIEGRRQDLSNKLAAAEKRAASLKAELEGMAGNGTDALRKALADAEALERDLSRQVAERRKSEAETSASIARAEETLRRCEDLRIRLGRARAEELASTEAMNEWALLERAFGRDGIQALEIDAAGPELSALCNELLSSCYGPRFEGRFVTQEPTKDGKKMKEVFDLNVIDHEEGREGSFDDLSGGEKVPVGEAVSLALAIYAGKHSGHKFETLFRDESVGACDPENAGMYIQMLRKAMALGGVHQLLFIAQQPEVWQQADAVIWAENGTVEVREGAA